MFNESHSRWVVAYLRGIGQIMLQESHWTGLLFLAGIAVNSELMLGGALLGALSGVVGAKLLNLGSNSELSRGYFGFNGALVGIAVLFFFPLTLSAAGFIVVGSVISSLIMRWLSVWGKLPPYTAPFVATGWIVLVFAHLMGVPKNFPGVGMPLGEFAAVARGVGQVMFQDNWLTGVVFLAGLAVCSLEAAAWAAIGSAIGLVCARGFGYPADLAFAGIFGFNAALAGIALSSKFRDALAPLIGVVLSVLITRGFQATEIPPLTAPFVLSSWLVIVASRFTQARVEALSSN